MHFCLTLGRLTWKLLRRDQAIMEKYDAGMMASSSDEDDDKLTGAAGLWKKAGGMTKTAAILKLSAGSVGARMIFPYNIC